MAGKITRTRSERAPAADSRADDHDDDQDALRMTRRSDAPKGWKPGEVASRYAQSPGGAPSTYNAKERTVEVVIATDYRVRRWFGWEELAIREDAVDLKRVALGQCRLLDSHNQYGNDHALGVITSARVERGKLIGTVRFNDSESGREAEQAVARGEITGISAGYKINRLVLAETGDDNDDDVYRAEAWELLEASLVSVPADPYSGARSEGGLPPQKSVEPEKSAGLSVVEAARIRMRMALASIWAKG